MILKRSSVGGRAMVCAANAQFSVNLLQQIVRINLMDTAMTALKLHGILLAASVQMCTEQYLNH